ncbi:MAG: S46 family peptidase [Marinilabiliaceae bacterium]|nr:S46 family peptidase [Marinilabiliaceae bacterium]
MKSHLRNLFFSRLTAFSLLFLTGIGNIVRADEGMWMLPLIEKLNVTDMQAKGFRLTAEDIYSINHSSIKDAVVMFHNYCTGEMVSDKGLLLTNHHCGYDRIQSLSSVERNFLEDGYWAASFADEIYVPDLTVTFLKRMDDVTSRVLEGVTSDLSEAARQQIIATNCRAIEKEAIDDTHYTASVKPFFAGNQYFLSVYEVFKDVRLVGTPPSSIGKFGHDTDNWMWPRHTGDFSLFRVYAAPDGSPADFSLENVPLKPAHHLPVSTKGFQEGDFAMTMGYPGSTDRYVSSWGIDERMNIVNHSRIKPRGVKQDIWMADMQADDKVKLQYASKYARSSNYWKNSIGMNLGLTKLEVPARKRALEARFAAWVAADSDRVARYGNLLDSLASAYRERADLVKARSFLIECLLRGAELPYFAYGANALKSALQKNDTAAIRAQVLKLRAEATEFYKNYSPETDRKVLAALTQMYAEDISPEFHPSLFKEVVKRYKGDFGNYADDLFRKSIFANESRWMAFLDKPSLKRLNADMAFVAGSSVMSLYGEVSHRATNLNLRVDRFVRLFQAGIMEMDSDLIRYSDANFTMRMSYGNVGGYMARDAVYYNHFTTLEGVMEKEDSTNWEFVVDPRLKALHLARDYGRYADANGELNVCFISNNDITGGNSGSPVINGNGELIGLAFDGNWEAMSGDIAFEPQLQKCINVDIRYVLFVIDKFAGATRLIEEMTIR